MLKMKTLSKIIEDVNVSIALSKQKQMMKEVATIDSAKLALYMARKKQLEGLDKVLIAAGVIKGCKRK
jgi:precorrin-4 methylase